MENEDKEFYQAIGMLCIVALIATVIFFVVRTQKKDQIRIEVQGAPFTIGGSPTQ